MYSLYQDTVGKAMQCMNIYITYQASRSSSQHQYKAGMTESRSQAEPQRWFKATGCAIIRLLHEKKNVQKC